MSTAVTTPSPAELASLDLQINASEDVNAFDKKTKRGLLRKLFFIGNECKKQGVHEDFLRDRLVHEAVPMLATGKNWAPVFKRVPVICGMWERQKQIKKM